MVDRTGPVCRRRVQLALGTSALAWAFLAASGAQAQCSPDPTSTGTTTTCTGTDTDGLTVGSFGTRIVVADGALVQPGNAGAAITVTNVYEDISVNGTVVGGTKPGIAIVGGPLTTTPCDPYAGAAPIYCAPGSSVPYSPPASATITVAAGATVSGSQAISLSRDPSNMGNWISAGINNAGTLTGTAGPAIVSTVPYSSASYVSITNQATGLIAGASGTIAGVTNFGTIDNGTDAAIATTVDNAGISNTGQIVSTGAVATITGTGSLHITNESGAVLGGSATTIDAGGAISLTNAGTINGSIVSAASAGQNSTIDTRTGTINGNLTLGAGDDTLRTAFDPATGRISSISGTVDGGAGTDTLAIAIGADATIGRVTLPTNFELLGLDLANNATATLSPAFATNGSLALSGYGTVINQADLSTNGQAAVVASGAISLTNQATIVTTTSDTSQYAVSGVYKVINDGEVIANGGGGISAAGALTNTGDITATGGAVTAYTLANSGSIRSTDGTGVTLLSSYYDMSTNDGSISGSTTGINVNGGLTNSGTITGGTTGVAFGYTGTLINTASGIVTGGTDGVSSAGSIMRIVNAGTINGDVDLATLSYASSNNMFVDAGGTVNGAIRLGRGDDQLVVDLAADPTRPLAGATGGVDAGAGYNTLRYRVNGDASATLALVNGFQGLAYELDNNAALTLTAPTPLTTTIGLTGNGTVTLNGTLSTSDRTLIDATIPTADQLTTGLAGPAQALSIVNNGALTLSVTTQYNYLSLAGITAGSADVTNNGSITINNVPGGYEPATAIFGGPGTITNNGSITLTGGGTAIIDAQTLINTGTITDTSGSDADGVSRVGSLQNSGIIRVDGTAVSASYYSSAIVNSGTIESRMGTAIAMGVFGATLTNEATGTIKGVTAIGQLSGSTIINRGTIIGDIIGSPFAYGSTYFADGGTVAGNVSFGEGDDLFLTSGPSTGVSGTIDGGDGRNTFGQVVTGSRTVSLDLPAGLVNFQDALVQASGSGSIATVTASTPYAGNLYLAGGGTVVNQATINGTVQTFAPFPTVPLNGDTAATLPSFSNQGTINGTISAQLSGFANSGQINSNIYLNSDSAVSVTNSGTINAAVAQGSAALFLDLGGAEAAPGTATIVNSGTIAAKTASDGLTEADALNILASTPTSATINNAATGVIRGDGRYGFGIYAYNTSLTVDNAGTISGGVDAAGGSTTAILSFGTSTNTIRNSGTLEGAVMLDAGNDQVENSGTITGPVYLGEGDDTFIQHAGATLGDVVDGGDGDNSFIVDATGNGSLAAGQLTEFAHLTQIGAGTVTYAGSFAVPTIALQGGTLAVAAGQTLATTGATTVTGGDAGVAVTNAGTIAGGIALGAGNDVVVNTGTIAGPVSLGAGDDHYVEGVGSTAGLVDGGGGTDLYTVMMAGDRSGIGQRTGFEQLAVRGNGTLSLALDQDFQSIALDGTNLTLSLDGHSVGAVTGSNSASALTVDGDVGRVVFGSGDDVLSLGTTQAAGSYDGGAGTNQLRFTATAPVTLSGTAVNFQSVSLAGQALTVSGTLGTAGAPLSFGAGDQSLTIANGGTLAGVIDLGDGNDSFRLMAGGTLNGSVNGGAGSDTAVIEAGSNVSGTLTGFETVTTAGTGPVSLAGSVVTATLASDTDLTIEAGGSVTAAQVRFGAGGHRFTVAGGFAGSVTGGGGADSLVVSGGSEAAPVMFGSVSGIESYRQTAGFARVFGSATFDTLDLTGGRLVGQGGSTITAPQVTVGQGATFGSAGTVNGDVTIAGTLSPGASPGTMTVNGNVTLAGGSTSLFELTPIVSDKLVVNGKVSIGSGSTLQLVPSGTLRPGTSYTLVTATGGITGSYSTILKPESLFGFVVQRAGEIDLLGAFLDPGTFGPQVSRSIAYANATLAASSANGSLIDALPTLLTAAGASNPQAFARLTPEPYASATQIGVDDALLLADATRGPALGTSGDAPHAYTVAAGLGHWHRLSNDPNAGTSAANNSSYGLLGGIGFGDARWSVAAFGGYLNNRQSIGALAARTDADGAIAGAQARFSPGTGLDLAGTLLYDGGRATTKRVLPVGSATGRYDLHSWAGDLTASYAMALPQGWALKPQIGLTYVRTLRDGATETGGSPFALTVARDRHVAGFADGAIWFGRNAASPAPFRPFVSFGARYQFQGRRADALAGYGGGDLGLVAFGATRARLVGTASAGIAYRLRPGLDLFATASSQTGEADHQETVNGGVRLHF